MTRFGLTVPLDDPGLEQRVRRAVAAVCTSRGKVTNVSRKRVQLTSSIVEALVVQMVGAATQAASRSLPNRAPTRGAPPDNARIISLAWDTIHLCREAGLSGAVRHA